MAVRNNNIAIHCSNKLKNNKVCGIKSKKESSEEVAFQKSEKEGWTKKNISKNYNQYFCPKCSHAMSS